ncbi:bacterioferritin-associated ferredoxin [Kineosphaera limosa]|uniref:Bacterioferritin-associated ferredoxin n=1 Tax=Kineosphaera limosa NBRC 100340 TaxID=1184609 RepID=K6XA65_9MICO|nr:(2Fe-2S)-binding protein [Kineosphaera limosa]NYD99524.1 bacterioferritin-associated ferredoxin [Kineosphaera limosa]GAB95719.1 hypothetical protein KILIM_025_00560 [Kineosphaera limosa NBRC 100340]
MIVCQCRVVRDHDITAAMAAGATTLGRVCRETGAGTDCGSCVFGVRARIEDYYSQNVPCPLHAVPDLPDEITPRWIEPEPVLPAAVAVTDYALVPSSEESDAAPQPPRRRVA